MCTFVILKDKYFFAIKELMLYLIEMKQKPSKLGEYIQVWI